MTPEEFSSLRQAGYTYRQIADTYNLNPHTLRRWAQEWGYAKPREDHPLPVFDTPSPETPSLDELMSLARQSRDILDRVSPSIVSETVHLNTNKPVGIIFTSCAHLGGRYTFYEEFERIYKWALGLDRLYWVSLGDDIEGFLPGFPDAAAVVDQAIANPAAQRLMLAHVLDGLAERQKLLAGCASQHGGDWVRKKVGDDPIASMYMSRGVPYFKGKGLLKVVVGSQEYAIALAHEFPGHSQWSPTHAQRRAGVFDFPNADVVVMGDKHNSAVQQVTKPGFEVQAGLVRSNIQWLVQVGTMKTGNDPYSIRGWSMGNLGWPTLILRGDRHEIAYAHSLDIAQILLQVWS